MKLKSPTECEVKHDEEGYSIILMGETTVHLTDSEYEALAILESTSGISIAEQIIQALNMYLERHELNLHKKSSNGEVSEELDTEQGAEVYVAIGQETLISSKMASDGKAMAQALTKLAESGSVSKISDPSAWQRQQRQDRALPGRDT